ncbi:hypothetical protein [Gryllotalpicola protaetiae]|nr:hypothetical protein [Gryllotalpicola protaetiae]
MIKKLIALAALAPSLALAGCVASAHAQEQAPRHLVTIAPISPSPSPDVASPAATGIVDTVLVDVYPGKTFKSKHGCGCTVPGSKQEMFPAGTPAILVKITLTGEWKPSQGDQTTQAVTGLSLGDTKFDGRPERAVLDIADGPRAAATAGLPWLPAGLFAGHHDWTIPNEQGRSFAAVWYLPPGVDRLLLTVDIPSEGMPNDLIVPLPADAVRASNPGGE